MTDPDANRPGKPESCNDFSLDRERKRIRVMKFTLAVLAIVLLLSLIVTLVMNQS